jgi:hypothetical protein
MTTTPTVLAGGCLCGGVRYRCSTAPVAVLFCHCKDCQRCTGGPFAVVAVVRSGAVEIVQGQTRSHTVTGEDGGRVFREFCPACGSPLFSGLEADRRLIGIKAGSLDDSSQLKPTMHIWTDSAVAWLPIADELPKTPRNPGGGSRAQASRSTKSAEEKNHA